MKAPRIEDYYQTADLFFQHNLPVGLTYDDVSLATLYSEVLPRQTNLATRLSSSLELQIPIISSDMDTVTESKMAIQMALNGGLGLIHYNMSDEKQVREVARVKNHIHGFIQEPIKVQPEQKIGEVIDRIADRGYGFSTFPVVDDQGHLLGLLPGRVVKARYAERLVSEAMSPRDQVYTLRETEIKHNPIKTADQFFTDHLGIHKLLVVDDEDRLRGLFTLSDIERIEAESQQSVKPARDSEFRLMCGAAISAHRKPDGELDRDRILKHVGQLVDEGVDAVAVSTAHGFSKGVGDAIRMLRNEFKDLTLIAGNVTSAEGVEFLADAGANTIKIGQGPGSICTTRVVAGVGIPQMTALYCASIAARKKGVTTLADGGNYQIRRYGQSAHPRGWRHVRQPPRRMQRSPRANHRN
jgi:IMP dehydrogenase